MYRRRTAKSLMLSFFLCAANVATTSGQAPAPQDEYVFTPDTDRWVGVFRKKWLLIGKLDAEGTFISHEKHNKGAGLSQVPRFTIINYFFQRPKTVYELRSGRLIKGEMTPIGDFVPEVGSAVIKFEDYKYSPNAIPVWNLPGSFQKKGKPIAGRDVKYVDASMGS
jgi:hypothetical protein